MRRGESGKEHGEPRGTIPGQDVEEKHARGIPESGLREGRPAPRGELSRMAHRVAPAPVDLNSSSGIIDFRSILHAARWHQAPPHAMETADEKTPLPSVRNLVSASDAPLSLDGETLHDPTPPHAVEGMDPQEEEGDRRAWAGGWSRTMKRWTAAWPSLAAAGLMGAVVALGVSLASRPSPSSTSSAAARESSPAVGLAPSAGDAEAPRAAPSPAGSATAILPPAGATAILPASPPRSDVPRRGAPRSVGPRPARSGVPAGSAAGPSVAAPAPAAKSPPASSGGPAATLPPATTTPPAAPPDPCNGDLLCAMKRAVGEH